jgi:phosphatidylglycerophosphate synthase
MNKNIIDYTFTIIGNKLNPTFYKLGITPNFITLLSFGFGLLASFLFYKDYRTVAGLFYIINYFFDCADGNYARKYKMVSKFGDLLDHVTDIVVFTIILLIMYNKNSVLFINLIPAIAVLILFTVIDIGCKEKHKCNSETLNFTKVYCVNNTLNSLSSYFNIGFINILIMLVILFYN